MSFVSIFTVYLGFSVEVNILFVVYEGNEEPGPFMGVWVWKLSCLFSVYLGIYLSLFVFFFFSRVYRLSPIKCHLQRFSCANSVVGFIGFEVYFRVEFSGSGSGGRRENIIASTLY